MPLSAFCQIPLGYTDYLSNPQSQDLCLVIMLSDDNIIVLPVSSPMIRRALVYKASKLRLPPVSFTPQNYINELSWSKLLQSLSSTIQKRGISKMSQYNIQDNVNCFNVWNNYTVADEKSNILAWLSPLEPRIRHHDIRTRRVDGVGEWFLQTEEYRNWFGGIRGSESDGSALFCCGGPGVGKTYIR